MSEIKRDISGLNPNTRYIVRIRAISGFGIASEWSEALDFTTIGDDSTPRAPVNLLANFDSPNLIITWTAVSLNTDGTFISDFSHYEVKLTPTDLGDTKTFRVFSPYFTYEFGQNQLDYGSPKTSFNIEIRTVDISGNASDALVGSAVNLAPPTSLESPILTAAFTIVNITMTAPASVKDLSGFDLYHSDTLSGVYILLSSTIGDFYSHQVNESSEHFYKYKIRDVFNQISPDYSPVATVTTDTVQSDVNTTPPSTWSDGLSGVPGVDTITQEPYVDLTWNPQSVDTDINHYEIRYKITTEFTFVTIFKGSDFTSHRVQDLINDTHYQFQIRAVDNVGLYSDWIPSTPIEVITGSGNLKYDTAAAGSFIVQGSGGSVRSQNWVAGTSGWKLSYQGLEINQGIIRAPALQIGVSSENLLINSSFENSASGTLADNWTSPIGIATFSIDGTSGNFRYQSKSQSITSNVAGIISISQTLSVVNGRLHEELKADAGQTGTWVTGSYWIKQTSGLSRSARITITDNTNANDFIMSAGISTASGWSRVVFSFYMTLPVDSSSLTFKIEILNTIPGDSFRIDGAQLQLSSYVTSYSPATLEIPDNYIVSAYISSLTADKITTGTIDTAEIILRNSGKIKSFNQTSGQGFIIQDSGAVFQNGSISIIGSGGNVTFNSTSFRAQYGSNTTFLADAAGVVLAGSIQVTPTEIKSLNYDGTSFTGWKIANDGSAELNNVTVRGNVQGNANSVFLGGTFKTASTGSRIVVTGNSAEDFQAPTLKVYSGGLIRFNLIPSGMYIGGGNSSTAPLYYDTSTNKLVLQNVSGAYTFAISTNPTDNYVLRLTQSSADKFYLKTNGDAYFAGTVSGTKFVGPTPNVVGDGSGSGSDTLQSSNFLANSATTNTTADIAIGATSITVADTTNFSSAANIKLAITTTSGTLIITATKSDATHFVNIPASGAGSITTTILSGASVYNGQGWRMTGVGDTELNSVVVRGSIVGSQITGSDIVGGRFKTALSGARISIDSIGGDSIDFYTSNPNEGFHGQIFSDFGLYDGYSPGINKPTLVLSAPSTTGQTSYARIRLTSATADSTVSRITNFADAIIFQTLSGGVMGDWTVGQLNTYNSIIKGTYNSSQAPRISTRGGNSFTTDWVGGANLRFFIDTSATAALEVQTGTNKISINGNIAKAFVIDHPTKQDSYLQHACIEYPEAIVGYRGKATLEDGHIRITLPEYFEALTNIVGRTVKLTAIRDDSPAGPELETSKVLDGGFDVYGDGDKSFFWEVKAERKDVPRLEVEPLKNDWIRFGEGPYTWLQQKSMI